MRIFYFPSFYPSDRPSQRWLGAFTHRQVKAMKGAGVEVNVILPQSGYPVWPFWMMHQDWKLAKLNSHPAYRTFEKVDIFHPSISNFKPSRVFREKYSSRYHRCVRDFLKRFAIDPKKDFFFAQWLPEAAYVVELGRELGIRTAILGIGDDILKVPHQSTEHFVGFKECWKNADVRGVVADFLGREANSLIGENLPYEVFYSSVDFDEFHPVSGETKLRLRRELGIPTDQIVILTVGSPIVRKGWIDLLDALQLIPPSANLALVGVYGGKGDIDLSSEVRKREFNHQWIDIGEVAATEMPVYYQMADIFCLPSHWEGLANAVLEAMSSGVATVTTPVSGHPEVIKDGENAVFVEVGDVSGLASALYELAYNVDKRRRIAAEGRRSIFKKPGSHHATAKKIFTSLCNT